MMDKHTKNEIKVGIVSILGIFILVAIILFSKNIFAEKSVSVLFVFDNSSGLISGSPVVVNGVKRGIVENVWNADNKVFVKATLSDISDIKEDCFAVISMLELMGGKKIELYSGETSIPFNPANPIIGQHSTDLQTVVRVVGDLTENLTSIVINLDTLLSKATAAIGDSTLISNIRNIVYNTSSATAELKDILHENNQNIQSAVSNLQSVSSDLKVAIMDNKPQVERIINNVDSITEQLKIAMTRTDTTFTNANNILSNINIIINDIQSNNGGTISKLLYDKDFANKLDSLMITLDSLARQLNEKGIKARLRF